MERENVYDDDDDDDVDDEWMAWGGGWSTANLISVDYLHFNELVI
jgi:hypothetical protein